jgi:hypothetical protein
MSIEKETIMRKLMRRLLVGAVFTCLLVWSGTGISQQQATGKTDASKYGKYIVTDIITKIPEYGGPSMLAYKGEMNTDITMGYHYVTKPILFGDSHFHKNHEILCFIGANPQDITDFGAVVEMELGPEHEKHVITKTACISMPPNLQHCPLNIKKVDKPIIFMEISQARSYKAIEIERPAAK